MNGSQSNSFAQCNIKSKCMYKSLLYFANIVCIDGRVNAVDGYRRFTQKKATEKRKCSLKSFYHVTGWFNHSLGTIS